MSPKRILNIDLSYFPKCTEALTRTFSKVKTNLHLFLLSTGNGNVLDFWFPKPVVSTALKAIVFFFSL